MTLHTLWKRRVEAQPHIASEDIEDDLPSIMDAAGEELSTLGNMIDMPRPEPMTDGAYRAYLMMELQTRLERIKRNWDTMNQSSRYSALNLYAYVLGVARDQQSVLMVDDHGDEYWVEESDDELHEHLTILVEEWFQKAMPGSKRR